MSRISISVENPLKDLKTSHFLHKTLNISLKVASQALEENKKSIFFTEELYTNTHNEVTQKIRKILDYFDSRNIKLYIIETEADENIENKINEGNRISEMELINILDESEDRYF